jgi:ABC-type uncharacterized transport system involved in gliding motility auxiliary subunit
MKRFLVSLIGVLGAAALVIGANMIADSTLAGRQLDLTAQRVYTLAAGTKAVLANLADPITLRLYYSKPLGAQIPQYAAYHERVQEMLRQYAELAPGKIRLEFHDPEPYSDTEDRATAYGLQGVPLDQSGERVFFGLEGNNQLDDQRAIPFFQQERERFLEYDLTKLIYELSNPKRATLGVMTPLKMDGDPQRMMMRQGGAGPWAVMTQLRQTYNVRNVALDAAAIDPDIDVLMVVHPQNLSDATLYAIDQFVMRGGKLLAMVGPSNETLERDPQTGGPPEHPESDLPRLFKAWGIEYDPNRAVGDLSGAWKMRPREGSDEAAVNYVGYFSVRDGINHDDPATADLSEITVDTPGYLGLAAGSSLSFTPLLTSSDQSAAMPADVFRTDPNPTQILNDFKPDGQRRVLAARIRGELHSAFDKAPDGAKQPFLAQSNGPANIVVVADTDMLSDRFWTRSGDFFGSATSTPFGDNGAFISNLVGTLAGGDELIGLRSRGSVARPFEVVDAMQQKAELQYRQTETVLTKHLDDTAKKLADINAGRDGSNSAALNEAQRAGVEELRRDMISTRGKLRQVQLELRHDIATLQTELQLFNVALVPGLLLLFAVVMGLIRSIRRARRPA